MQAVHFNVLFFMTLICFGLKVLAPSLVLLKCLIMTHITQFCDIDTIDWYSGVPVCNSVYNKLRTLVFQPSEHVNISKNAYDLFNISLMSTQGILWCVANNSLGRGNDSLKLYMTGELYKLEFSKFKVEFIV